MTAIVVASNDDAGELKQLLESAYRGDSARKGWNHEADLLDDERVSLEEVERLLANPDVAMLAARDDAGAIIGCVAVTRRDERLGYLGMLCVSPTLQSGGLGGRLLHAAERQAQDFGLGAMEMTVISQRETLIAWYERRGYVRTGERRPFPVLRDPPLEFVVLEKPLGAS
ncbi:GNAT family N-acetyltransferase [Qipengyuania gelatinilytica]|uniref:GNAT family N-acetyltransferase n=1 Tax=Qipengyuania gelatinilytica TaxID=2867231 RepID=UPI001FFCFE66|nr:GNAT family N-acetyltransferase [Qipengyuania gelatinilytica]